MKKLSIVFLAAFLAACSQQTTINKPVPGFLKYDKTHHFFMHGIGQSKSVNAVKVCGSEDAIQRVEAEQSFGNVLAHVLTLTIYSPMSARVYCVK